MSEYCYLHMSPSDECKECQIDAQQSQIEQLTKELDELKAKVKDQKFIIDDLFEKSKGNNGKF